MTLLDSPLASSRAQCQQKNRTTADHQSGVDGMHAVGRHGVGASRDGSAEGARGHLDRSGSSPCILPDDSPAAYRVHAACVLGIADGAALFVGGRTRGTACIEATNPAYAHNVVGTVRRRGAKTQLLPWRPGAPYAALDVGNAEEYATGDVVMAAVRFGAGRRGSPWAHILAAIPQGDVAPPAAAEVEKVEPQAKRRRLATVDAPPLPAPLARPLCAVAADCGVRFGFDASQRAQAQRLAALAPVTPSANRTDLRDLPFVTIDPKHARVLDQALHIERAGDDYVLRYAIADIDALLPEGCATDIEAASRGASAYIGCGVPEGLGFDGAAMLPSEIVMEAGSLLPEHDRLAVVVTVRLDARGEVSQCDMQRAVIRSRAKLSVSAVQWFYDHEMSGHHVAATYSPSLCLLGEVGKKLVARANARGFGRGAAASTRVDEWNSHLSIVVNEQIARLAANAGLQLPYLGNGALTSTAEATLRQRLAALGYPWPEGEALHEYLSKLPDVPHGRAIRHLAQAMQRGPLFSPRPVPHATLRLRQYVHFTAPLRRYEDVVTHRVMAAHIEKRQVPYQTPGSVQACIEAATAASTRQHTMQARRGNLAAVRALKPHVGKVLDAWVVGTRANTTEAWLHDIGLAVVVPGVHALGSHQKVRVLGVDDYGDVTLRVQAEDDRHDIA